MGLYSIPGTYYSAGTLALLHCAQYLWVTGYYARRESLEKSGGWNWKRYYGILILGGIVLFVPAPWIASRLLGHDLFESIAIVIALVNLHHFILDGAIWKLRDGSVARFLLRTESTPTLTSSANQHSQTPSKLRRAWVAMLLTLLALFAVVDQMQYWLTAPHASRERLSLARWLNPNDSRIYYRLGMKALAEGDANAGLIALKEAIELNPYNAPAQHHLGQLLMATSNAEDVYAHYEKMTALFRPNLAININGGLAALESGRPVEAIQLLEGAMRMDEARIELHQFLGKAFLEAMRPDDAKIQLSYSISQYLKDAPAKQLLYSQEDTAALAALYESITLMIQVELELGNDQQANEWKQLLSSVGKELATPGHSPVTK